MVYWNTQEVIQAIIGGLLIALASTLNLLLYGRITGISGAFNSVIKYDKDCGFFWKYYFIIGLFSIPKILQLIFGHSIKLSDDMNFVMFDSDA